MSGEGTRSSRHRNNRTCVDSDATYVTTARKDGRCMSGDITAVDDPDRGSSGPSRRVDDRRRPGDRHNKERRRVYERDRYRLKAGSVLAESRFVGVDGEGGGEQGDKHPGYHAYFLLRAGDRVLTASGDRVRLTTSECLEMLSSLDPRNTYVGYFFDYDVTKILEDLPFAKLERLMNRASRARKDGRGVFPVDYGPYELDYLPHKEFKVRRGKSGPWVVINDVGPFFQCRFVQALRLWKIGTEAELGTIEAGKDMRGNFDLADIETIDHYNRMEIKLLQELMTKFREACSAVGLRPSKWQGPGQLAKALLANNGVRRSKDVPLLNDPYYTQLLTYGRNAYYGGRPELAGLGPVEQPVLQYDINSAYPAAMAELPCLEHGGWEYEEYVGGMDASKVKADAALLYGSYSPRQGESTLWYGLPHRDKDGSICYPTSGAGWYWSFEVNASIHQCFSVQSAWIYNRQCSCKPLGFIPGTYQQRLDLGKDGPGIVLKLTMNSVYGVMVQSIGRPEYANPVWGSFITAWCRTKIQDFIHSSPLCGSARCGTDVLMVATDSVASLTRRTDIDDSRELGGWSVEEHPQGMFLIQPGLYFGSSGKHAKTRGVPLAVITEKEQDFRDAFRAMVASKRLEDGDVSVPQHMFVGIRYALHRNSQKLLGQWIDFGDPDKGTSGKTIRFDWTTKRAAYPVLAPTPARSYLQTFPKQGDGSAVTTPYAKDIGGLMVREAERLLTDDQPDWVGMVEPGEMQ